MPVTLNAHQKYMVYEMLGIMSGATFVLHDGFGIKLNFTEANLLKAQVDTDINALDDQAATEVISIVADWDLCKNDPTVVTGAGGGAVSGIVDDPKSLRDLCRQRLPTYIAVLHLVEAIAKRNNQRESVDSCVIGIRRSG